MPFLDPDVKLPQIVIVCAAGVLLLVFLIVRYILWHTARVYVYNEERRIHDVVSRQFVRVRTPKIRLSALQGHAETEYTVILRRKLAKRLILPLKPAKKRSIMWLSRSWEAIMRLG